VIQVLQDNFIEFVFSSLFGVVITISLFFFTSHPTTADKIKTRLRSVILKRLQKVLCRTEKILPEITSFLAHEFDIHPLKSIVMFGLWEPKRDAEWYRWIAIFEPQEARLSDKLVGRSGFYELQSFSYIKVPSADSLVPSKIEVVDFDGDGIPEVHVTLKSTWADSASIGPLFLRKRQGYGWQALALPSISALTSHVLDGNLPHPDSLTPVGKPFPLFGMRESSATGPTASPLQELKNTGVYEDKWILTHNGEKVSFVTLRNGGMYQVRRHPIRDHLHIITLAFFADDHAVLGAHFAVVNVFALAERFTRDLLWNWGFPMISEIPLRPPEIDIDAITKAGVVAHIIWQYFFWILRF
jgi:hypothetical protein